MTVGNILVDFSSWTSAHGVPHVGSAQHGCLRIFWLIVFIICTSLFIANMSVLVERFVKYEVTVQTELRFEEREFPVVTMCNLNPFLRKKVKAYAPAMFNLSLAYKAASLIQMEQPLRDLWYEDLVDAGYTDKASWIKLAKDTNLYGIKAGMALQSEVRARLVYLYQGLKDEERKNIVYELEDINFTDGFVVNCAYNTRPCYVNKDLNITDFAVKDDPNYGRCFAFNPEGRYKSARAGPLYGLRLLAVTNQEEYLPTSESAGVRVAVHGMKEDPYINAFGFNAAVGFTTSFGVKYIRTIRLPAPHGNCTNDIGKLDYYYGDVYQVEGCLRSCYQRSVIVKCHCADPRFNRPNSLPLSPFCSTEEQRTCVRSMSSENATATFDLVKTCGCPQPCTESTYAVTVSTALWPSDVYTPPECKNPDVDGKKGYPWGSGGRDNCTAFYKHNTMLLEIYYERMNFQMLTESEAYSLVNLISDMGGQLGLWMGISVITVVEFISLMILLCLFCLNKKENSELFHKEEKEEDNAFDIPRSAVSRSKQM